MKWKPLKPDPREPVHRLPAPVPVTFEWPISATFQPDMDGVAIAWQGGPEGITLVRLESGHEGWVRTRSVQRIKRSDEH